MEILAHIDFAILDFIQYYLRFDIFDKVMEYINMAGNYAILWIVIALLFLFRKSKRKFGMMMILSLIFSFLIGSFLLTPIINEIREVEIENSIFDTLLYEPYGDYVFPLEYVLLSFSSIAILLHYNRKKGTFWSIIAFFIAFAGLYLYKYYPTDIIIGLIVGLIIGNISKILYYSIEKKRLKRIFKRNNILYQREKQMQNEQEEKINQDKEEDKEE